MIQIRYQTVTVLGLDIFYREAGPQDAPTVLLLHGFPTSLHMFRNLIPALAVAGAEAYKRDLPGAELYLLDAGHLALEAHGVQIAQRIRQFMQNHVPLLQSVTSAQRLGDSDGSAIHTSHPFVSKD